MRSVTNVSPTPPDDASHRPRAGANKPAARIAWLQGAGLQRELIHRLENKFDEQGIPISVTSVDLNDSDVFPYYDLLVLEYLRCSRRELARMIVQVRRSCAAPIIVLAKCAVADLTVAALRAGADTVIPVNTTDEVIVARCQALLRRWYARSH
jgi:DNA-binding response OmpR family regulator